MSPGWSASTPDRKMAPGRERSFQLESEMAREETPTDLSDCSRARLKVAAGTDPLTRRDGFAGDAGSMVVVEIWAEISDFG